MIRIRTLIPVILLCLGNLFAGEVTKINAIFSSTPQFVRKVGDNIQYLKVGDIIWEDDLLITSPTTKAQIKFDNLIIDISYGSELLVKQEVKREKYFKAKYSLNKGRINVDFDSKKYNERELIIDTKNVSAIVTGTKFTINASGYITVKEGIVNTKDNNGKDLKTIKAGQSAGPRGPLISPRKKDDEPVIEKRRDTNPPESKDKEPKKREPREPFNSDRNKAPKK